MDTELLVDQRIDEGTKLISQLLHDGFNVVLAFWAKTREEGLWFLYVVSDDVDTRTNLGDAYRRLYASLSQIANTTISLTEVKLINSTNPIAQAAIKVQSQFTPRGAIRSRAQLLGGLAVDEVYIYPRLGPMTPVEVMQAVLNLMSRRGTVHPSQINLHDGSTVFGVPCGIRNVGSAVQIDVLDSAGASRSIVLDQIASIQ